MTKHKTSEYSIEREGGALLFKLPSEVTLKLTPELKREMVSALENAEPKPTEVAVDLSETSFMDSTGISALVVLRKRCKEMGVEMRLLKPSEQVRKILDLVQLTSFFQVES